MDKTTIIAHCSATPPSMDVRAEDINRWHLKNGWSAIGYAYVITRDAKLELGRDLDGDGDVCDEIGAHAAGFNAESIGICIVGGVNEYGASEFNFTRPQMEMFDFICSELESKFPTINKVAGHRDLPGVTKQCPCFNVAEWRR